jgi:hypothetical protein
VGSATTAIITGTHIQNDRRPQWLRFFCPDPGLSDTEPARGLENSRAAPTGATALMAFVDWEGRPAVIVGSMAWAVLAPGEGWTEVNSSEVAESGRVTSARVLSAVYGPSLRLAGGNASLEKLIIAADRQA